MKHAKKLGLGLVVAALMAFLGGTSASATVLCKTSLAEGCAASGWDYSTGTKFVASLRAESTTFERSTGGAIERTCAASTITGELENTGSTAEAIKIWVTGLTFGECSRPAKVLATGTLEIAWNEGTDNGTLAGKGFEITIEPVGGVSCVYSFGSGTTLGTVTGGSPATIDVNAVVNKKSGSFLCPSDSIWEMSYVITEPKPLYVSNN
jgi:hypothetical protein